MVLVAEDIITQNILLFSNNSKIESVISSNDVLPDCNILFARIDGDIFNQFDGHAPHIAIIDSTSSPQNCIEISGAIKQRFNIPVILLIDPDNLGDLIQATNYAIDSVLCHPVQNKQLITSIQFHLLKIKQNQKKLCMPRQCNIVTQHIKKVDKYKYYTEENVLLLDRQDFINKVENLLEQIDNKNAINACIKLEVIDRRDQENPHWKKESLNLLNRLTNHIRRQIRFGDILARDTGYQYLLLFPNLDKFTASNVIKRINQSVSDLLSDHENGLGLQVAAGASIFDQHADAGVIIDSMERALEEAMRMGDRAFIIKSLLDPECETNANKVSYANIIQNALNEDSFFLDYQPIISLADDSIKHYEALLRLQDKEGNFFQPWKIISVAEHNHKIREIDIRILDHVMRKISSLEQNREQLNICVNLSGTHFGDKSLLEDICILIDYYGIDPSHLVFEMTETAAVKDLSYAYSFITRLKELGCQFGLDDFGTGYASFSYLRALPVDYLKIDGTFVKEILENPADQLFVKAIVDVARGINVKTIAECVEDKKTLEMLTAFGVDFAQGFYIGRPAPLNLARN